MYFTASSFSTNHTSTGLLSTNSDSETSLLSNNSGNNSISTLFSNDAPGFDTGSVGGKDILFGNPDLSSTDASFFASAPQTETAGSVAYNSAETVGSVACNSAETAGSVACGAASGDGGGCGGGGFSSFC